MSKCKPSGPMWKIVQLTSVCTHACVCVYVCVCTGAHTCTSSYNNSVTIQVRSNIQFLVLVPIRKGHRMRGTQRTGFLFEPDAWIFISPSALWQIYALLKGIILLRIDLDQIRSHFGYRKIQRGSAWKKKRKSKVKYIFMLHWSAPRTENMEFWKFAVFKHDYLWVGKTQSNAVVSPKEPIHENGAVDLVK